MVASLPLCVVCCVLANFPVSAVLRILDQGNRQGHYIDGRCINVKRAVPKHQRQGAADNRRGGYRPPPPEPARHGKIDLSNPKMFIGGLPDQLTQDEFRRYFEAYGEVADSMIMIDRISGRSRGFGFITFVDPAAVGKVMKLSNHTINGKYIECKRAETRQQRAGRGGGGGSASGNASSARSRAAHTGLLAEWKILSCVRVPPTTVHAPRARKRTVSSTGFHFSLTCACSLVSLAISLRVCVTCAAPTSTPAA